MSEKFRIDLGYDPLFASASFTTRSDASVVVYDTTTQAFFYTGSYGGGSGGGGNTGSFTGSFTGSISGSVSEVTVRSVGGNTYFPVTLNENAGTSDLLQDPVDFKYNPSLDTLIVDGTISASNFISVGTVAGTKVTGSFTGSFTGDGSELTGVSGIFPFTGSAAISGTLSVEGEAGHITSSGNISASGTGSFGMITSDRLISHTGDVDTGLQFASDTVIIEGDNEVIGRFSTTKIQLGIRESISGFDGTQITGSLYVSGNTAAITSSGNISASGTGSFGNLDINGAVQLDGTFTVGANDQGYDVTLFGDTANKKILWDASSDHLKLFDDTKLVFGTGANDADFDASIYWDQTDLVIDSESDLQLLSNVNVTGHITASGNVSSSGGTITGLNYINNGVVANSKITGSFTGSFTGDLTGTSSHATNADDASSSSFATVAAGLVHTPDISVGTLTNASTVAGSNITGSFTGSFTGDGSELTGVSGIFPFTGSAAISGTLSLEGEAGHITSSGNISASGDITAHSASFTGPVKISLATGGTAFEITEEDEDQKGRLLFEYDEGDPTLTIASRGATAKLHIRQDAGTNGLYFDEDGQIYVNNATSDGVKIDGTSFSSIGTNANALDLGKNNRPWKDLYLTGDGANIFFQDNTSGPELVLKYPANSNRLILSASDGRPSASFEVLGDITNTGTVANSSLTGSFTGSFTGDGSGLSGVSAGFPFTGSAAISGTLSLDGEAGHITSSGNISSSGGTITALNYQNTGTVAASDITGSFTGSFTGDLTGTSSHATNADDASSASFATVAAGLVHTPDISVGTLTNASTVAGSNITGSFTGSYSGSFNGSISNVEVSANGSTNAIFPLVFANSDDPAALLKDPTPSHLGFNPQKNIIFLSGSIQSTGSIGVSGSIVNKEDTIANTQLTGSFTGSLVGALTGTSSWANNATDAISASFATVAAGLVHTPDISVGTLANTSTVAGSKITGSFTGSFAGAVTGTSSHATNADDASSASFSTVAAGLVHTPDISIGTLTNASTVAGSNITGSFTGSYSGSFNGSISNVEVSANGSTNAIFPLVFANSDDPAALLKDPTPSHLGFNPQKNIIFLSGSIQSTGSIGVSGSIVNKEDTIANTQLTGSFTGSLVGALTGTSSWANNATDAISASFATVAAGLVHTPDISVGTLANTSTVAGSKITGSFTGSFAGAVTGTSSHATNADDASSASFSTVAAGLVHTPDISIGTLTNTSTVAGSKITGSFTGSFTGDGSGLSGVTATPFPFTGSAAISGTLIVEGPSGKIASRTASFGTGLSSNTTNPSGTPLYVAGNVSASGNLLGGGITINGVSTFNSNVITLGVDDGDRIDTNAYFATRIDVHNNITSSGNISSSGGTITALNYQNTGTVANTSLTGSFTGSHRGIFRGTGPNLTQIGTTVGGTSITGSITGSFTGDITLNTGSQGSTPLGFASGQIAYFGGTSGVVAGAVVVLKSNGLWAYANATNDSLSTGSLGVALGTNPSTDGVLMNGFTKIFMLNNGNNGAIGDPVYLENANGRANIGPPTTDGNIVRIIGHLISGSTDGGSAMIHFNPSPDFIEHA